MQESSSELTSKKHGARLTLWNESGCSVEVHGGDGALSLINHWYWSLSSRRVIGYCRCDHILRANSPLTPSLVLCIFTLRLLLLRAACCSVELFRIEKLQLRLNHQIIYRQYTFFRMANSLTLGCELGLCLSIAGSLVGMGSANRLILYALLLLSRGPGTTAQSSSSSCGAGSSSTVESVVSTTSDAEALSLELLLCSGREFSVTWEGNVGINQTLGIADDTTLHITGSDDGTSIVHSVGDVRLFEVNGTGSALYLESITLQGGRADCGGAVAVRQASITLLDCDVNDNEATSEGGKLI